MKSDNNALVEGFKSNVPAQAQAMTDVAAQREMQEVRGMMLIAKQFPRDERAAIDKILNSCTRLTLAQGAVYSYARGGTDITGPSIRLAEAIAQSWGNLVFGVRELEQRNGESTVEAFAWDIESNTRQSKTFQVSHVRHTKTRQYRLEDPRDIYEAVANQGSRRVRACILGLIPGDVVEMAVNECEKTLQASADLSPENLQKMLARFQALGVTKEMIEKNIQRRIESINAPLYVRLGSIYQSMLDGMSKAADWFEVEPEPVVADVAKTRTEQVKADLKRSKPGEIVPGDAGPDDKDLS